MSFIVGVPGTDQSSSSLSHRSRSRVAGEVFSWSPRAEGGRIRIYPAITGYRPRPRASAAAPLPAVTLPAQLMSAQHTERGNPETTYMIPSTLDGVGGDFYKYTYT